MRRARPLIRALVILFCCWHMFAVAVYAVPNPATDRMATWIRTNVNPLVRPYIYVTSQWQQWNLFSPDPMRRATEYTIWSFAPDRTATPLLVLDRDVLRWWRRSDDMASVRRLEDSSSALLYWKRFLESYCGWLDPAPGTRLQLAGRYQIVPKVEPGEPQDWWRRWEPEWTTFEGPVVNCLEAGRASDTFFP